MITFFRAVSRARQLQEELEGEVRQRIAVEDQLEQVNRALDVERTFRIAAETVASERRGEIDRLHEELKDVRSCLASVTQSRMESLDALNVRLMKERVEPPPPDMAQFRVLQEVQKSVRAKHREVDMAILSQLHPKFAKAKIEPVEPPNEEAS